MNIHNKLIVPRCPKKIVIGTQARPCNLRCPKCFVWGVNNENNKEQWKELSKDIMPMESIIKIFDEIKYYKPALHLGFWTEPVASKYFKECIIEANKRGIAVNITTNALLINDKNAQCIIDNVKGISVSIDATTSQVLLKTRATDKLEKIKSVVKHLVKLRGNKTSPRISVNFTVEECNKHQKEEFLDYWIKYVDSVKFDDMFNYDKTIDNKVKNNPRIPCREIYDQMIIDYDGSVRICCVDGFRKTNMGNVFIDGVLNVWNGVKLTQLRNEHEQNDYKDNSFCKNCDLWSNFNIYQEKIQNNLLIRNSIDNQIVFYNRLDKIHTWTDDNKRADISLK